MKTKKSVFDTKTQKFAHLEMVFNVTVSFLTHFREQGHFDFTNNKWCQMP